MTTKRFFLFLAFFACQLVMAQYDSIQYLDVVRISDVQLKSFSDSQSVLSLSDSLIRENQPSLTSLLNYNTVIYFKENGLGMVSSPSFRGTTAQQTAVIWNGININSQLTGQTDFNTITTRDFQNITVRAGGGSALYGSSAIGGSIHLNNELNFKDHFSNELHLNYGSFNTIGANYKVSVSDTKFSFQAAISRNSSDNDYKFPESDWKNQNGEFYNTSLNMAFGYKINARNYIKAYSQFFDSERHFAILFPAETKTKYQDFNSRNLLEWDRFMGLFTSRVKVAYLSEKYKYFANIANDNLSDGKVETVIGKYDLTYDINTTIKLNAIIDYTQNKGTGTGILHKTRNIGSAGLLFKHEVGSRFLYELSGRKEVTDNYKSPVLFSVGANYKVTDFYTLKLNGSRNFRVPTFNDLYWEPGGNPDLKPESSYQAELGNSFAFKELQFSVTGYYMDIKDMLRWIPMGANWSPVNTDKVITYGGEAMLNWSRKIGMHQVSLNGTYAYTVSENDDTKKQLIYVPHHKATGSLTYSVQRFTANYQALYVGEVYTRTDNNSRYTIDPYLVGNATVNYTFGKKFSYTLGVQVLNLWNENYQSVENRFLPGRNINTYLTLNF